MFFDVNEQCVSLGFGPDSPFFDNMKKT